MAIAASSITGDKQDQQHAGTDDVEDPLQRLARAALHEAVAVDEPTALQAVDRHFAARRFGVRGKVHHRNAADAAGQQFIHRHAAAALLAHGNDDLVHAMARNQVGDRLPARKHAQPALRRRRRFGIDRRGIHADDVTAMAARRLQVLRQCQASGPMPMISTRGSAATRRITTMPPRTKTRPMTR